jgi:hypothetical protein
MKYTTEEFIKKARQIHGDKYDYSLVEYINNHTKVKIICHEHGVFEQIPKDHLNGRNCRKCGFVQTFNKCIKNRKITQEDFIERANNIHNNKYDYSLVEYKDIYTKVKIICHKKNKYDIEHGIFEQSPLHHIYSGSGCIYCKRSSGEEEIEKILIENNVLFKKEYIFDDCKNIRKLPFDFYLPDYNTLIEYQGVQHHKNIWGQNRLNIQIATDKIKKEYCFKNNIHLEEIWYNENTQERLQQILKS